MNRVGLLGISWAARYRRGWTVFTRDLGIVAEGLTITAAKERVSAELARIGDTLRFTRATFTHDHAIVREDTMSKIKSTFDIVIAIEMDPAGVRAAGYDPIIEPNGKSYCPLGEMRASAVLPDDTPAKDVERKAVATACFFFKQRNPEWADSKLVGLSPELLRESLVR